MAALCGIALVFGGAVHTAKAGEWDKLTTLTVTEPIQVTDTYLEPGTYVFKLADLPGDRHVVQIFNSDQSRIINTVMAIPNYRLEPTGNSRFQFWETPPGTARALRAWFYPGDNFGQEFRYPRNLHQIAMASQPAVTVSQMANPESTSAATQPAPSPAPTPLAETNAPVASDEQSQSDGAVEMAQNTAPQAPASDQVPDQPAAPMPTDTQLPKTASPYPAIGLAGVLSLGLYGFVTTRRRALEATRPE